MVPSYSVETIRCSGLINSFGMPVLKDTELNQRIRHIVHQKLLSLSDTQIVASYKVVDEKASLKTFRFISIQIKNFLFNKDLYKAVAKIILLPVVIALCVLVPMGYYYLGSLCPPEMVDSLVAAFLCFYAYAPLPAIKAVSSYIAYPVYLAGISSYMAVNKLGFGAIDDFKKVIAKSKQECFSDLIEVQISSKPSSCKDIEIESILNRRVGPDHEPLESCRDPITAQMIHFSDIKQPKYIKIGRYVSDIKNVVSELLNRGELDDEHLKHPFLEDRPLSDDEQSELFQQISDFFCVPVETLSKLFFYKLSKTDKALFADQALRVEKNFKKMLYEKFLAREVRAFINRGLFAEDMIHLYGNQGYRFDSLLNELELT
jgi:hypothetical protein